MTHPTSNQQAKRWQPTESGGMEEVSGPFQWGDYVEGSEYDELQQQNERLRAALREISKDNFLYRSTQIAIKALSNECTCPSGNGSLRWPCPIHPPSRLRVIEPFRSKDGVRAEVFKSSLGGPGCVCIEADTASGDEAEVTLNAREAHDLMLWLQCALSTDGSAGETGVKEIGDTFECVLRVEITSDAPNKVDSFRRELCNLILDAPSANNADVMVTIHGASGPLPVFETNRKPSAVETKPDDEDVYIHGPGTFPHSDGCRCERCSPPNGRTDGNG